MPLSGIAGKRGAEEDMELLPDNKRQKISDSPTNLAPEPTNLDSDAADGQSPQPTDATSVSDAPSTNQTPAGRLVHFAAVIKASPIWRIWFDCNLSRGYDNFRATIFYEVRLRSQRGLYAMPPILRTHDISIRCPDALGTDLLTEKNFGEWKEWYEGRARDGMAGEGLEGLLEVSFEGGLVRFVKVPKGAEEGAKE
ncbi:MAG: hypothetical protein LQ338_002990 [Usnochroma carphineum]|nr:MAG: hypothetical protein LQ338_002990 [Usnochroma carphineum]